MFFICLLVILEQKKELYSVKRFAFYISLIILPILILAAFEGGLRLFGYGKDYSLLKRQGDYYLLNPDYPAKFFSQNDISIPEFVAQKIPVRKARNTKRIVCLGGSTTEGFPFEIDINFPHFLQCYLQKHYRQKHWQVINLGLSAINSHSVRNMAGEILKLQPDAVLIYMGHNEFYGALGLASASVIGSNPSFVQFLLKLKSFRIYQLLDNFIHLFSPKPRKSPGTLMAAMIKKSRIVPDSPVYRKTLRNFKINLKHIVSTFEQNHIPVLVGTLVSNLKDQEPLGFPDSDSALAVYAAIRQALKEKNRAKAKLLLRQAVQRDSLNPLLHYFSGQLFYQSGQFGKARRQFLLAKDLDQMPFRAPSAMNEIIRKICQNSDAQLVKIDSLFGAHSPHGITDSSLFLEHLHPNAQGYQWLALGFFNALARADSLSLPPKSCARFTNLDVAIGELKIADLVSHPPFNGRTHFKPHRFEPSLVQSLAYRHVFKGLLWDAAHLQLGDYFERQGQTSQALKEYFAVLEADSLHFSALYKIGDLLLKQKKIKDALAFYGKAVSARPKVAFLKAKLARALLLNGNESEAIDVLNAVINTPSLRSQLSGKQMDGVLYLKAIALTKLGKAAAARRLMKRPADEFPKKFKTMNQSGK